MPVFHGSIVEGQNVVLPDVSGEYHDTSSGHLRSWAGSFTIPGGGALMPGSYILRLDDGRQGHILIHNLHHSSGSNAHATFKGSGPPPQ